MVRVRVRFMVSWFGLGGMFGRGNVRHSRRPTCMRADRCILTAACYQLYMHMNASILVSAAGCDGTAINLQFNQALNIHRQTDKRTDTAQHGNAVALTGCHAISLSPLLRPAVKNFRSHILLARLHIVQGARLVTVAAVWRRRL